jgi:hypothetical protein
VTVFKNFSIDSSYVLIQKETILNKKSEILKIIHVLYFNEHSPNRTWTHCVYVLHQWPISAGKHTLQKCLCGSVWDVAKSVS